MQILQTGSKELSTKTSSWQGKVEFKIQHRTFMIFEFEGFPMICLSSKSE